MILQADARHIPLADGSVQCCVTSPPYWGLRDYGTATWMGGDAKCKHTIVRDDGDHKAVVGGRVNRGDRSVCLRCGAKRVDNQLGLEPTPEEYVANMVAVFREVRRVLRDDGTLWLNLGDSYAGAGGTGGSTAKQSRNVGSFSGSAVRTGDGLKPKDLVGIPWRVAFALQADGWWLRSDIIWHKPNPMPESVTDRPTKSHEYMFLLTKSQRYYYDAEAVKEAAICAGRLVSASDPQSAKNGAKGRFGATAFGFTQHDTLVGATRNRRSVWTIATRPYSGAHFATFPPALVEPCVLAGSAPGDVVLDPFGGSGTTAALCRKLGRECVSLDINPVYLELQRARVAAVVQSIIPALA